MGGRKRGGEEEGATEQGPVLCLEVIPKASHHIQLDKGIGEISVCVCVCVCTLLNDNVLYCIYISIYIDIYKGVWVCMFGFVICIYFGPHGHVNNTCVCVCVC